MAGYQNDFLKEPRRKRSYNAHGVEVSHFRHELRKVTNDLQYYTYSELAKQLTRIAKEAEERECD